MPGTGGAGTLQLQVLKAPWAACPSTVADVHAGLPTGADLACTTVATMLRKTEARGRVRHRTDGRKFVDQTAIRERHVTTDLAGDVLDRAFEGRLANRVHRRIDTSDVSAAELDELSARIADRRWRST